MKITKNIFLTKICLLFIFSFLLFTSLALHPVSADSLWDKQIGMDPQGGVGESFGETVGDRNEVRDVRLVIANAIRVFLGFMGVIFLVLMIYAGITWMTAAGQDDKINKAKSLLIASVIGLIIVVSSFAIAQLITDKIFGATLEGVILPLASLS